MKIRILLESKANDGTVVVEPLWDRVKKKASDIYHKSARFVVDHKEETIATAAAVGAVATSVSSAVSKVRNSKHQLQDDAFRRNHYYDRSVGAWVETKHQLNANELRAVKQLQGQGMRLWEALDYLNLLRR